MCIDAPEKAIFRQLLLVGATVSLGNIVIHALVMMTVVRVIHPAERHRLLPTSHMIVVTFVTVSVLMGAHTCEVLSGRPLTRSSMPGLREPIRCISRL
jgi:hypothetical protein